MDNNSLMPGRILLAYDANKERNDNEFKHTINGIRLRGDIIRSGDTIMVLGVLHRVLHPFGYQLQASPEIFSGSNIRLVEEEVSKRVDMHVNMLLQSAEDCKDEAVDIEVKITAGTPIRKVVLQEATTCNATWLILDRSLDHSFSSSGDFSSTSKQEKSGRHPKGENKYVSSPLVQKYRKDFTRKKSYDAPFLCVACGMKTELYIKESMRFSYSEIQLATDDFSKENLLGEGGYGHVYKGELKDGQFIAAKVRKETSTQGLKEFNSELYVLSFARHKNIVILLGYCCKEKVNILVYEYICNKSLEWHLFDKTANVLDWHQRRAIAIETAKGLRFLHEECRGSPIIHRDLRPSNILLTHDFVPMLGDFGLAKWKTSDGPIQTRIVGTFGYLAPEYAENGIVSVRTDVYAFGIVLIQLISGRKALDSDIEDNQKSLRQWAEPLIARLALHQLTDPRLGESYDTYELYHMARTAYLCVKSDPEMRPSMGEVVRLLEGEKSSPQLGGAIHTSFL